MIANKADGGDHNLGYTVDCQGPNDFVDVGLQPGFVGIAAPALVGNQPAPMAQTLGH